MRAILLKDGTIPQDELNEVLQKFIVLYTDNAGITPDITIEERNFDKPKNNKYLPAWFTTWYQEYYGGFIGMRQSFLKEIVQEITKRHGKRYDHIIFLVSHENWIPRDRIWGWNLSAGINGYQVQQCRFDTFSENRATRIANSLGTLYHEVMHSHVHFIYQILGININTPGKWNFTGDRREWTDWGNQVVHGEHEVWNYIRYAHNTDALDRIAPWLRMAYAKRKQQYRDGTQATDALKELTRTLSIKLSEPFALPFTPPRKCKLPVTT